MTEVFAKLSKLCFPPSSSFISSTLTITAKATLLTDLKLASATISLPCDVVSAPPSPAPLRIQIPAELVASGNHVVDTQIDALAQRAEAPSIAFIGPGTINGRKKLVIDQAFGTREIYSNGAGGFYTLGGDTNFKEGKALMLLTAGVTALGDGDTAKTRTASINIPATVTADLDTLIATASISMTADCDVGNDLTWFGRPFTPGITLNFFMQAEGFATENLNLTNSFIYDFDDTKGWNRFLARVDIKDDGYVYQQIGDTGIPTQVSPSTDWIDQKANVGSKDYRVRCRLIVGTQPTLGNLLNIWIPITSNPFWQNTFPSPAETYRSSILEIDISDDGGSTVKDTAVFQLILNSNPL